MIKPQFRVALYCIKLYLEWQQIFTAVQELLLAEGEEGIAALAGAPPGSNSHSRSIQTITVQPEARSVDLVESLAVDAFHLQLMGVSRNIDITALLPHYHMQ